MNRWIRWFAVLLSALVLASPVLGVLPQQLKSARLTDATPARNIDNEIGNVEKALADILGLPLDTDITAAPFSITAAGVVSILQPNLVLPRVNSNLIFTDNLFDIGASGATRPRNLFLAGDATIGDQLLVSGAGPHAIGGATSAGVGLNVLGFTGPSAVDTFGLQLAPPIIVGAPTNAATLKITGTPTGATNNYALWVDAGTSRMNTNAVLRFGGAGVDNISLYRSAAAGALIFDNVGAAERMRFTDGGILALGTTVTTGAAAGDLVLANGGEALRFVNFAGAGTLAALSANASDQIVLGPSAHVVPAGTADTVALLAATQTLTNKTITFSGTADSTKACATGYTRVLPNYCRQIDAFKIGWTDVVACTSHTADTVNALPAEAKLAFLSVEWRALSNNAVGLRANNVTFHNTSACSAIDDSANYDTQVREEVAVVAGTVLHHAPFQALVPLTGTNTFHTTQLNAGGNGNVDINSHQVVGYFD